MNKKSSRQKNSNQDNCKEDNNIYSEESDSETNKKLTKDQIIEQLRNEFVSINDEKTQLQQVAQRSQADLINYKNRTEQEKTDIREKSKHNIILKLITVVDDVERAIASLPKNSFTLKFIDLSISIGATLKPSNPSNSSGSSYSTPSIVFPARDAITLFI